MTSHAPLSLLLNPSNIKSRTVAIFLAGIGFLALLSQVAIPLPWTVVPITGQTFGVTLISLLYGRKLGTATVVGYLVLGAFALPLLAQGSFLFPLGPTSGYLVGMIAASWLIGFFSDRGATRSFFLSWGAGLLGSVLIFGLGLAWLSQFIPSEKLLIAGLYPFLLGDLIKTAVAAGIARESSRRTRMRSEH